MAMCSKRKSGVSDDWLWLRAGGEAGAQHHDAGHAGSACTG
jgi:hypothetical protein